MGDAQIPSEDEELARQIISAAIEVHRMLTDKFREDCGERINRSNRRKQREARISVLSVVSC
jgi:hypothetical protein